MTWKAAVIHWPHLDNAGGPTRPAPFFVVDPELILPHVFPFFHLQGTPDSVQYLKRDRFLSLNF
jgi:hypothetical protein